MSAIQLALFITGMWGVPTQASEPPLRILMESPPATLNPRNALDAAGQRIGGLLFRGLTRIDPHLDPQPDLAQNWEILDGGKKWKFKIRPGQLDHAGLPIGPTQIAECLEQYRAGKPAAPAGSSFPFWTATRVDGDSVVIEMSQADPYLDRNLSLLRYFRSDAKDSKPCSDPPAGANIIGSGILRADPFEMNPETSLNLVLADPGTQLQYRSLKIDFVRDETTRALKLIRGEADAMQNGLSLSKILWLEQKHSQQFKVFTWMGVQISYLSFNMSDPALSNRAVRQAIALALDRHEIVQHKLFGFAKEAGSLLAPMLPESEQEAFEFNPAKAQALLDQAGLPRDPRTGVRLRLKQKCGTVRDNLEAATIMKDMLSRIGIEITLEVVEPAVFLASIRKGAYQLYVSRWVGVSDGSILYSTLQSKEKNNRARYRDNQMDTWLGQAMAEPSLSKRTLILQKVQRKMAEDLPYLPLWHWKNFLAVRSDLAPQFDPNQLSLSGALEPLVYKHPSQ